VPPLCTLWYGNTSSVGTLPTTRPKWLPSIAHCLCLYLAWWHEPGLCCCAVILVCCMQVTKDVILQQAIQAFRSDFQAAMQRTQVRHTRAGSTNRPPPSLIWQTCNST
jgi:hypothetical protein